MLWMMAGRRTNPRRTLAAFGAPLMVPPRVEMPLEEAVVRALVSTRRDSRLLLALPVVLLKNAGKLHLRRLVRKAKERGVEAELGMFLDLAAKFGRRPALSMAARKLHPREGAPRYYPRLLGGVYEKQLADERTPAVAARWGFRMNATEADLRGFVRKHLG